MDQRPVVDGPGQQQQWDAPSAVDAVVKNSVWRDMWSYAERSPLNGSPDALRQGQKSGAFMIEMRRLQPLYEAACHDSQKTHFFLMGGGPHSLTKHAGNVEKYQCKEEWSTFLEVYPIFLFGEDEIFVERQLCSCPDRLLCKFRFSTMQKQGDYFRLDLFYDPTSREIVVEDKKSKRLVSVADATLEMFVTPKCFKSHWMNSANNKMPDFSKCRMCFLVSIANMYAHVFYSPVLEFQRRRGLGGNEAQGSSCGDVFVSPDFSPTYSSPSSVGGCGRHVMSSPMSNPFVSPHSSMLSPMSNGGGDFMEVGETLEVGSDDFVVAEEVKASLEHFNFEPCEGDELLDVEMEEAMWSFAARPVDSKTQGPDKSASPTTTLQKVVAEGVTDEVKKNASSQEGLEVLDVTQGDTLAAETHTTGSPVTGDLPSHVSVSSDFSPADVVEMEEEPGAPQRKGIVPLGTKCPEGRDVPGRESSGSAVPSPPAPSPVHTPCDNFIACKRSVGKQQEPSVPPDASTSRDNPSESGSCIVL